MRRRQCRVPSDRINVGHVVSQAATCSSHEMHSYLVQHPTLCGGCILRTCRQPDCDFSFA